MKHHRLNGMWTFAVLFVSLQSLSAAADETSKTLIEKVLETTKATVTLTANFSVSESGKRDYHGTMRVMKPNKAQITVRDSDIKTVVSNGKTVWILTSDNKYWTENAKPDGDNLMVIADTLMPLMFFIMPGKLESMADDMEKRYIGKKNLQGMTYEVVELKMSGPEPFNFTYRLFINPAQIITRAEVISPRGKQTHKVTATLENVKLGQTLPDTTFTFTPPKNAKRLKSP